MNVLLAFDGSPSASRATGFLAQLLSGRRDEATVHVAYVQPVIPYLELLSKDTLQRIESGIQATGGELTRAAGDRLLAAHIPSEHHALRGEPAEAIVRAAQELECTLIVMGTRGMGPIAGLALGSVASKVVRLADAPVLLVK